MYWEHGQRAAIADAAKIERSNFYAILNRRRGVSVSRAMRLEKISRKVLGYPIPWVDWVASKTTNHPAFAKKTRQRKG